MHIFYDTNAQWLNAGALTVRPEAQTKANN